ncbi:MAG: hypothetical protein CL663_01905 [Bacteroidetes bacterium]|nr:hypothetical protein [Bacteroidota bacterium]
MNIGIIIGRIGGVDGVALETLKWIDELEKMGHKTFIISGDFENWQMVDPIHYKFPVLSFFSPEADWEQRKAFFEPDDNVDQLMSHIHQIADDIEKKIEDWVVFNKIDVILSENASALPCHISMGLGIKKFIERTSHPIVTHDHDFHWERGDRYKSPHKEVNQLVNETFPLLIPHVKHAVINTFGVNTFKKLFKIDAVNVPNVMDFNKPYGVPTEENKFFLRRMGVAQDELALLQVTRIVRRKGIETAIELMHKLNDPKLKLVITGNYQDDEYNAYYKELVDQIYSYGLMKQVIFGHENVLNHMDLSDVYAHGTACTYFSTYEGFGNAFVEAILAKKPIFVNNYKPVYWPDIGSKGFRAEMIEDSKLTDESVKRMSEVIYNPRLAREIGEYNFELGKKHFSYEVLEEKLTELFSF